MLGAEELEVGRRRVVAHAVSTGTAALLVGCGGGSVSPTVGAIPEPNAFESTRWEPVNAKGARAHEAYLVFDGPVGWHGSDGCTEVRGSYQYFEESDGRVAASTPDQDPQNLGSDGRCDGVPIASALQQAAFLRISKGRLLLVSEHDQVILRLTADSEQKEPAASR